MVILKLEGRAVISGGDLSVRLWGPSWLVHMCMFFGPGVFTGIGRGVCKLAKTVGRY